MNTKKTRTEFTRGNLEERQMKSGLLRKVLLLTVVGYMFKVFLCLNSCQTPGNTDLIKYKRYSH